MKTCGVPKAVAWLACSLLGLSLLSAGCSADTEEPADEGATEDTTANAAGGKATAGSNKVPSDSSTGGVSSRPSTYRSPLGTGGSATTTARWAGRGGESTNLGLGGFTFRGMGGMGNLDTSDLTLPACPVGAVNGQACDSGVGDFCSSSVGGSTSLCACLMSTWLCAGG